jgi:hypothetical protein
MGLEAFCRLVGLIGLMKQRAGVGCHDWLLANHCVEKKSSVLLGSYLDIESIFERLISASSVTIKALPARLFLAEREGE